MEEIKGNRDLKWPGKLKSPPNRRDNSKYCEFHKDHGHTIDNYIALKNKIENLIRRGKLSKFVDRT